MLFAESGERRGVHITFFGGETLMNFPLLERVVEYANQQAAALGRSIDFSLTTNATLLTPAIIQFLSDNRIGVTVSMDGPPEMHDALRVFANGRGSYDIIAPKVRELLAAHRTRPIAARVTLTSGVTDVGRIYRHLKHDLGFHEVGFAPVTTSPDRLYAIGERGMDDVFEQFRVLAGEYLEFALRGELHGFSNVSDTLAELYQGVNKSHPCGAGLGLMGVGPSGDIAPCHRFVDSDTHALGNIATGIDRAKQTGVSRSRPHRRQVRLPHAASRARCVPAAATTRHTCATATPAIRICTTATGFATGPTCACASTARFTRRTRNSSKTSPKGKAYETSATRKQEGAPHRRVCRLPRRKT